MKEQLAIQNLLREKLSEIQRNNPRYSLRSFAKKVGIHVGALTYIINGKRNVSRDLAERITRRLLLDPQLRAETLGLFPEKKKNRKLDAHQPEQLEPKYLALSAAQFRIAAEWEHFAVLSLMKCQEFKCNHDWISKRIGITSSRSKQVVDRLIEAGIVKPDNKGGWTRAEKSYRTPDDIADISLKQHHAQTLNLANDSLFRDSIQVRDFTTVTMAIDPSKISAAKELIRKQQDELSELLETGQRTEVYRLSVQLFPLSKANQTK